MSRYPIAALAALLLAAVCATAQAGHPHHRVVCDKLCLPHVEPGETTHSCWKVEYEEICIPGFRLPWSKCTKPVPGRVIRVKRLVRHDYQCPTCDVRWQIDHKPCAVSCCPAGLIVDDEPGPPAPPAELNQAQLPTRIRVQDF